MSDITFRAPKIHLEWCHSACRALRRAAAPGGIFTPPRACAGSRRSSPRRQGRAGQDRCGPGCRARTAVRGPSPAGDDDVLAGLLIRMWALASGRSLPPGVPPGQLSEDELIGFWADDLAPAAGRHAAPAPVPPGGRAVPRLRPPGPASGQVCAMLALDIAGFTRPDRDEETRLHIRRALYRIVTDALQETGICQDRYHREDRGDGILLILPPDIPARILTGSFPGQLAGQIRLHNRMSAPAAQIQLRAAAHAGPVYRDDHGVCGDDINQLFRMLDARPLRAELARTGTELALAISPYIHDTVIRRHPTPAGPARYRPFSTRVKGARIDTWIHLPGFPA
jgi:hypothetical protein